MFYFDIGHAQGKRYKKYFKERIYKYCNYDCNAYSDNCTMKHEKEWYTCDRCGKEIDRLPKFSTRISRLIMPEAELKLIYENSERSYIADEHKIANNTFSVEIVSSTYKDSKVLHLCPKCRKDFEKFMRNEHSRCD